ncbi:MAG: glycosyltransferase family 4 protein [Ignavibacteriae bacterium]|nr:glycosyltransferase family 4 protein [Ignavibacteriota bacterium]
MKPRFNILLTNSSDMYGGGEFYVLELACELKKRGHNIIVTCKPDNLLCKKCNDAGVVTLPLDFPPQGKLVSFVMNLKHIIQQHNIQIVHTNTNYDRTAGAFAAWLCGVKHVTNVHSFHSLQHNLTHWIRNKWATDHFLVDGICVKELLVRGDKISTDKISVVYLGVDPESMSRNDEQRRRVRAEFGLNDEHIVVGNVGRLVPMKGQEYLIKAFAEIALLHPRARLLIIGDGELHEKLKAINPTLQTENKIFFAGFRDDLPACYSAFDVYAHTSIEGCGETFPFAVLQALAQELPVVVTRVGDVAAMVEEGVNGFVLNEKDVKSITEKLRVLIVNKDVREIMAKQSRKILLQKFTINIMVDSIEAVYAQIVPTPGKTE